MIIAVNTNHADMTNEGCTSIDFQEVSIVMVEKKSIND